MLPVHTVEKEGFANLLKQFDPQTNCQAGNTFQKLQFQSCTSLQENPYSTTLRISNPIQPQQTCDRV